MSLLNPWVRRNFVSFSFRKNQERAAKFGSILDRDRGLVSNCPAAAGRAPNWTGRALNNSYCLLLSESEHQGSPRQTKPKKGDSQAGSRIWGLFVNSACFSWKKKPGEIKNIGAVQICRVFVNAPCFPRKTLRIHENTPKSRTGLRIGFLGLVCRGDS